MEILFIVITVFASSKFQTDGGCHSEYEFWVGEWVKTELGTICENYGQKHKFRFVSFSKVCDIFAKRVFLVSILKFT